MAGHIASAGSADWRTPERILEPVREFFGEIDLDPCASVRGGIGARKDLILPADGLATKWHGKVFVNPPFGTTWVKGTHCFTAKEYRERDLQSDDPPKWRKQTVSQWVVKAYEHDGEEDAETILLLPAAVDTKWWQQLILPDAPAVCFIAGRLRFTGAPGPAPMATALVYFGERVRRFRKTFAGLGYCA